MKTYEWNINQVSSPTAQIRYGNGAPTKSTFGKVNDLYMDIGSAALAFYRLASVTVSGGAIEYNWDLLS